MPVKWLQRKGACDLHHRKLEVKQVPSTPSVSNHAVSITCQPCVWHHCSLRCWWQGTTTTGWRWVRNPEMCMGKRVALTWGQSSADWQWDACCAGRANLPSSMLDFVQVYCPCLLFVQDSLWLRHISDGLFCVGHRNAETWKWQESLLFFSSVSSKNYASS